MPATRDLDAVYRALPADAAALYRGIGSCGASEFVPQIAAAMINHSEPPITQQALKSLQRNRLIVGYGPDKYFVPVKVRAHARDVAEREDTPQARHDVVVRVAVLLERPLREANTLGNRDLGDLPPHHVGAPWTGLFDLGPTAVQALEWVDVHRDLVTDVAEAALAVDEPGWTEWLCRALWLIGEFGIDNGLRARTAELRARAAEQSGDAHAARRVIGRAGMAAIAAQDWDNAHELLTRYADLAATATDPHARRDRLNAAKRCGVLQLRRAADRGDWADLTAADAAFCTLIEDYQAASLDTKVGVALMFRAQTREALGDREAALADFRAAVDQLSDCGDWLHAMRAGTGCAELLIDDRPDDARDQLRVAENLADAISAAPADRRAIYEAFIRVYQNLVQRLEPGPEAGS